MLYIKCDLWHRYLRHILADKRSLLVLCGTIGALLLLLLAMWLKYKDSQCAILELSVPNQCVTSLIFPNSEMLITGSTTGDVGTWEFREKRLVSTLDAHGPVVIACSPNGSSFVVNWNNKCVKGFNTMSQEKEYEYPDFPNIEVLGVSKSGNLLAAGGLDAVVKVWDVISGRELSVFRNHTHSVEAIAFFGDRLLATGGTGNDSIYIWDLATRRMLTSLDCHTDYVSRVFFLNEFTLLSMGSDANRQINRKTKGIVRIWDIRTGDCILSTGTESAILSGVVSVENKCFFSGCADGKILTGKCDSLQIVKAIDAHGNNVRALALSPDEKVLASTSDSDHSASSSIIRFWSISCLLHSCTFRENLRGSGRLNTVTKSVESSSLFVTRGIR